MSKIIKPKYKAGKLEKKSLPVEQKLKKKIISIRSFNSFVKMIEIAMF